MRNRIRNSLVPLLVGMAACRALNADPIPAPLQIISEPGDAVVAVGANISLTVEATGSPAPTYQWALNGEPIPGAVGPTLTLQNVQPGDCGSYSAFIQNGNQTIQSDPAAISVNIASLPFADRIASRGVIHGSSGVGRGNNQNATSELLEPWGLLNPVQHSVWLSWTAPQSGTVTFSTVGSGFDTVLGGFTVVKLPLLPALYLPVTIDDESGGYHTSEITFNVTSGTEYAIGVGSDDDSGGNIVLSWQFNAGQSAPLILLQPISQTVNYGGTASLAVSVQSLLPVLFQWFKNDVAIPGANAATLSVANVSEAQVGIYHCQLSVLGLTLFSSDAEIQINTEGLKAGARNKLSDAKLVGIRGSGSLSAMSKKTLHAFDISGSAGYSGSQVFQSSPGKDPGEPNACGVVGGSSYWLSYTAPANGVLTLNTDGSSFDTVMAVYIDNGSNQGYSSLVSVACDNNSGSNGLTSKVMFNVTGNQVYYIQIDGVNGAYGTVHLNYSLNAAPTISSISAIATSPNTSATSRSFTVSDKETAAGSLQVTAVSSNPNVIPASNIALSGTDGNRTISIQPTSSSTGSATITVTVRDAGGLSASTSFTVSVVAANRPPVANTDTFSCKKGSTGVYAASSLLANDTDPDGNPLSLYNVSTGSSLGGKITQSGSYIYYTPPSTVSVGASDYFCYTITDRNGGYATARVWISITQ